MLHFELNFTEICPQWPLLLRKLTRDQLNAHWRPLKTNGRLANRGLTSFVKEATGVQSRRSQLWLRQWVAVEQATIHYLNQWWLSLLTHICISRSLIMAIGTQHTSSRLRQSSANAAEHICQIVEGIPVSERRTQPCLSRHFRCWTIWNCCCKKSNISIDRIRSWRHLNFCVWKYPIHAFCKHRKYPDCKR